MKNCSRRNCSVQIWEKFFGGFFFNFVDYWFFNVGIWEILLHRRVEKISNKQSWCLFYVQTAMGESFTWQPIQLPICPLRKTFFKSLKASKWLKGLNDLQLFNISEVQVEIIRTHIVKSLFPPFPCLDKWKHFFVSSGNSSKLLLFLSESLYKLAMVRSLRFLK